MTAEARAGGSRQGDLLPVHCEIRIAPLGSVVGDGAYMRLQPEAPELACGKSVNCTMSMTNVHSNVLMYACASVPRNHNVGRYDTTRMYARSHTHAGINTDKAGIKETQD